MLSDIFNTITALREQINALRPLSYEQEARIMQRFRIDWNYHSNAIEGNTLDAGETRALLMHGLTAKGKPLKDHLDIQGHNEAINMLLSLVKEERPLTESDIRELHTILLPKNTTRETEPLNGVPQYKTIRTGQYKITPNHVRTITGETHYYASPEETPPMMAELVAEYNEQYNSLSDNDLIVFAALFHHRFTAIHPFDDGNGRMARLLMNLILMRRGFPPAVFLQDKQERNAYYNALVNADAKNTTDIVEMVAQLVQHSLEIQLRGARGEGLEELDTLKKELALFNKEMEVVPNYIANDTDNTIYDDDMQTLLIVNISRIFYRLNTEVLASIEQDFLKIGLNGLVINKGTQFHEITIYFRQNNLSIKNLTNNQYVSVELKLHGYKKVTHLCDIYTAMNIKLDKYFYTINFHGIIIKKDYTYRFTNDEIDSLVAKMGHYLFAEIKRNINN